MFLASYGVDGECSDHTLTYISNEEALISFKKNTSRGDLNLVTYIKLATYYIPEYSNDILDLIKKKKTSRKSNIRSNHF